jgi:N-methylhydantoinase B
MNRFVYDSADGPKSPPLVTKVTDIHIAKGQRVRLESPGGGGYGEPHARDPQLVAGDVLKGYTTTEQARAIYGVALGPDGKADLAATSTLRTQADR